MARSLVIVESPAKAKTINKYLGRNYTGEGVLRPRDGPAQEEAGHRTSSAASSRPMRSAREVTRADVGGRALQKAAEKADAVYLAADPDREGEAICAHLADISEPTMAAKNGKNGPSGRREEKDRRKRRGARSLRRGRGDAAKNHIFRVMFNEITPKRFARRSSIPARSTQSGGRAAGAPRAGPAGGLQNFAAAVGQGAARALRGTRANRGAAADRRARTAKSVRSRRWSTGRCMRSLRRASRLCSRPSWPNTRAKISRYTRRPKPTPSSPRWKRRGGRFPSVTQKEKRRYAPPPFTTSKLQQAAYNRLRYTAKRTMALAQRLYEGVELGEEGSVALITYMRTDSVRVSNDALGASARADRDEFWRELPAGKAELL